MKTLAVGIAWALLISATLVGCSPSTETAADAGANADGASNPEDTASQTDTPSGSDAQDTTAQLVSKLTTSPPMLQFGLVPAGQKVTRSFLMTYNGPTALHVSGIKLSPLSKSKAFTVDLAGPFTMKSGDKQLIVVSLEASFWEPGTDAAIAALVIRSDAMAQQELHIPIFASSTAPLLAVTPNTLLDFGTVGPGVAVKKKVSLFNEGSQSVVIYKVVLTSAVAGEFTLVHGSFPPTAKSPSAHVMKAGEFQSVQVAFSPKSSTTTQASATLEIHSDASNGPVHTVKLQAKRGPTAFCKIELAPKVLDFGTLAYGSSAAWNFQVKNTGTSYCQFAQVQINGCTETGCGIQSSPDFFAFAPSTKLFYLAPGDSGATTVLFSPSTLPGPFANPQQALSLFGLLSMRFKDVANGTSSWYPHKLPTTAASSLPNLVGAVGESMLAVPASTVDVGWQSIGCKSPLQEVTAYNTGTQPIHISAVELEGCGAVFEPVGWPNIAANGVDIAAGGSLSFGLRFTAPVSSPQSCVMRLTTTQFGRCIYVKTGEMSTQTCSASNTCPGGTKALCKGLQTLVNLKGMGTSLTTFTDEFVQKADRKVDVLLVIGHDVDTKSSAAALAANLGVLLKVASLWSVDYQIGVVATKTSTASLGGKLFNFGDVRVVSPKTVKGLTALQAMVTAVSGGPGTILGLNAMRFALSPPHSDDFGKDCKVNQDCVVGACVKGPDGKLGCGGHNRGFLRKDTDLGVLLLSASNDTSPGQTGLYSSFLQHLKGPGDKGIAQAHVIVGLPSDVGCLAKVGTRFSDVAKATGGSSTSICGTDYAKALKAIGTALFGGGPRFTLTMRPKPASLTVSIDGTSCAQGPKSWSYDGSSNRVTFVDSPTGTCTPTVGSKVKIGYQVACLK